MAKQNAALAGKPITVDIWADVVCPWCYIGKRRFEAGLAAFSASLEAFPVRVSYHSFELSPDTPLDFQGGAADYLVNRRGYNPQAVSRMLAETAELALTAGLHLDYPATKHRNTAKAHGLIHYAAGKAKQPEMLEALMQAYFVQGREIGKDEALADLAVEIGLDRSEALKILKTGSFLPAVRTDEDRARAYGINGVPYYVIDGKLGLSGAQTPETFTRILAEIAAERRKSATNKSA